VLVPPPPETLYQLMEYGCACTGRAKASKAKVLKSDSSRERPGKKTLVFMRDFSRN
jgi:hypothetical protein